MTVAEAWNGPLGQHWAAHPDRYNAMLDGFDAALFDAAAIGGGDRVVDIGCGSGRTTRTAAQRRRAAGSPVSTSRSRCSDGPASSPTPIGSPMSPTGWTMRRPACSSPAGTTWRSAGAG